MKRYRFLRVRKVMEPEPKHPEIEKALERYAGRTTAIRSDRCVKKPIGCEGPVEGTLRNQQEIAEYRISGLCGNCQREIFGY